jgi:hypothetical protein
MELKIDGLPSAVLSLDTSILDTLVNFATCGRRRYHDNLYGTVRELA